MNAMSAERISARLSITAHHSPALSGGEAVAQPGAGQGIGAAAGRAVVFPAPAGCRHVGIIEEVFGRIPGRDR